MGATFAVRLAAGRHHRNYRYRFDFRPAFSHYIPMKFYYTEKIYPTPRRTQARYLDRQAREQGVNSYEVTGAAARGDKKALKTFLGICGDGAAEEAEALKGVMIHLVGDDRLAEFLRDQQPQYQIGLRDSLTTVGDATYPFEPVEYLRRHFPKTAKLFFRREIDFPSPDGRYAVHKVFANDGTEDGSNHVVRSELIEKAIRKVIKDLTKDDQGKGGWPEGVVEWAPDSKRFLYFVWDQPEVKLIGFWVNPSPKLNCRIGTRTSRRATGIHRLGALSSTAYLTDFLEESTGAARTLSLARRLTCT